MRRLKKSRPEPDATATRAAKVGEPILRICHDPAEIDAASWHALVAAQPSATPFVSIEYLRAMHASASAVTETGWAPHFLLLEQNGVLCAACPLYLKDHSYGEYVFDWAWADAYQRHGLDYYPKLTGAIPFTPVPGPRLLARTDEHRLLLLRGIEQLARSAGLAVRVQEAVLALLRATDKMDCLTGELPGILRRPPRGSSRRSAGGGGSNRSAPQ